MLQSARVLVVDDDAEMCDLLSDGLSTSGAQVTIARSAKEAEGKLAAAEFDAVVTDLRMPSGNADGKASGLSLCAHVNERWPDLPVLVHTGFGDMDAAIAAMRAGAFDFLSKPVNLEILRASVARAVERRRLRREVSRLASELSRVRGPSELLGESAAMERVRELVDRVAKNDATVLVTGESGTGKEIVARAIHRASDRAKGPFVAINCASIPDELLEAELFGYEEGSFTGAKRSGKKGLLEEAHEGTLFLDEIGELPLKMQSKILRFLQEGNFKKIGGNKTQAVDVRILCATNLTMDKLMNSKHFRQDLFYRLAVIPVFIPPLRDRQEDIPPLILYFIQVFNTKYKTDIKLSAKLMNRLYTYEWPGNVRELKNVIERMAIMYASQELSEEDLELILNINPRQGSGDRSLPAPEPSMPVLPPSLPKAMEQFEEQWIRQAYQMAGTIVGAAKLLGINPSTIHRKLKKGSLKLN